MTSPSCQSWRFMDLVEPRQGVLTRIESLNSDIDLKGNNREEIPPPPSSPSPSPSIHHSVNSFNSICCVFFYVTRSHYLIISWLIDSFRRAVKGQFELFSRIQWLFQPTITTLSVCDLWTQRGVPSLSLSLSLCWFHYSTFMNSPLIY